MIQTSAVAAATHLSSARVRRALAAIVAVALQTAWIISASAQSADPVIARVNEIDIHASDIATAEEDLGPSIPSMTMEQKRHYLVDHLIDMALAAKASELKKFSETEEFKRKLAYYRNKVLMQMLLRSEAKSSTTEAKLLKSYEALKATYGEQEVRALQILVATEDEAKSIVDRLRNGADFDELAREPSKYRPGPQGGDLGYFTRDEMVSEFGDAAFALSVGEISGPVKTRFGWHIIKVLEKHNRLAPDFESVKSDLENLSMRTAESELIARLRAENKIEYLDGRQDEPAWATAAKRQE